MTVPEDSWIDDFTLLAFVSFLGYVMDIIHIVRTYLKSPEFLTVSPELESELGSDTCSYSSGRDLPSRVPAPNQ